MDCIFSSYRKFQPVLPNGLPHGLPICLAPSIAEANTLQLIPHYVSPVGSVSLVVSQVLHPLFYHNYSEKVNIKFNVIESNP